MNDGILIEGSPHVRIVTCLLRWQHTIEANAHCLARLMLPTAVGQPAAVLSEIASNPDELGITGDYSAAATAFLTVVRPHAAVEPQQIQWFAHHGPFSSYDPTGTETLTEVTLSFDGSRYYDDLRGHQLLTPEETAQALNRWSLAPVPDVLARLGQTN